MIFWRSNLNIIRYRRRLAATLIVLTALMGSASLLNWSPGWGEDSTDWPDPVYFPQKLSKPPVVNQPGKGQKGNITGSTGTNIEESQEPKQKKRWSFHKKPPQVKPLTDEQITQVGPKDPPAYPDPLLRLMFPVKTEQGVVQPGFYLVRQLEKNESTRTLALTRQHQIVFQCVVSAESKPAEDSPIQPVERSAPPRLSVASELSPDQKSMTIVLKEGNQLYKSQPFPTVIDARKILRY